MIKLFNRKVTVAFLLVLVFGIACQVPPPATPIPPTDEPATEPESEEMMEEEMDEEMMEDDGGVEEMEEPSEEAEDQSRVGNSDLAAAEAAAEAETGGPISDEEAADLMYQLIDRDVELARTAVDRIVSADDQRFISVFIELMRGGQVGLVQMPTELSVIALEELSGQRFGNNWGTWVAWYGNTELTPPPEFTTWKGELLSGIDPGFGAFLKSEFPTTVRAEEIQWGGVRVDGIPALDWSPMLPAEEAVYMDPGDAVFGLSINGDNRAYPLKIIDWHEMANDTVGGVPVSLAYCTLCGAAVAYDGRASDGNTYDFGSSGFLFRSNKLMYDRQTRTLWNQLTGEPVLGRLVGTDVKLGSWTTACSTGGMRSSAPRKHGN